MMMIEVSDMDMRTAAKEIDSGQPRPVYVCYGTEQFRKTEFIHYLLERCVPPHLQELAVMRFDLSETPLDDVLDEAGTVPFMAERKVILASNATFLTGARDSGKVEHRVERLLDYLKSPSPTSVVVLTVDHDKLDERKKVVKALNSEGAVLAFEPLSADELLRWIKRRGEQAGIRFEQNALEALPMYAGTNLQVLAKEIEKLSLYVGRGGAVELDTLDRLVVRSAEQDVFMLIDHIVHLRKDKALTILHSLLKQKEEPVKIAMLMARQFRIILQTKALMQHGYPQQQIAAQIGLHPYAVKKAAEQARHYTFGQLENILVSLGNLDVHMKTGQVDKVLGLELFILQLSH